MPRHALCGVAPPSYMPWPVGAGFAIATGSPATEVLAVEILAVEILVNKRLEVEPCSSRDPEQRQT